MKVTAEQINKGGTCRKCKAWKLLCGCEKPYRVVRINDEWHWKPEHEPKEKPRRKESPEDMLARVELMASGNDKWDLSPNDIVALEFVLARLADLERLRKAVESLPDSWREVGDKDPDKLAVQRLAAKLNTPTGETK